MIRFPFSVDALSRPGVFWRSAWMAIVLAYAVPVAYFAYGRVTDVTHRARERLIIEYRLWELHPEYHGTPQAWTSLSRTREAA